MSSENKAKTKKTLIIVGTVLVLALIIAGIFILRESKPPKKKIYIGQIDRDKVVSTKEFKEAQKKIDNLTKKYMKQFEVATKDLDEKKPEDQKRIIMMRREYQQKLMKEQNALINPLWEKAAAAVAIVAVKKKMNTVLDKRIVVCGAEDITDEVVALLEKGGKLEKPTEEAQKALEDKSKIGYFDKEVVVSLKLFRQANQKLLEMEKQVLEDLKKKAEKMTPTERRQLQVVYMQKMEKTRADLFAPLFRQVNRTVRDVAEEQKLNLVVNKENVMYGGKNITAPVVEKLNKP